MKLAHRKEIRYATSLYGYKALRDATRCFYLVYVLFSSLALVREFIFCDVFGCTESGIGIELD
jgi:hypothetical protein